MNTTKGYIIPVILIILLLVAAGIFMFTRTPVESPIVDTTPTPTTPTTSPTPVATSTDSDELDAGVFSSTTFPIINNTTASGTINEE